MSVEDLERPELAPYRTMRRPHEHEARGIFVAEGALVVERLIASALVVESVLTTADWCERLERQLASRGGTTTVYVAPQRVLEEIVGFRLHQGVMAVARVPRPEALGDVLARSPAPSLLVALDGVTNPQNIGIIIRNCVAFGVTAAIIGESSASPWLRRAVRNSMGTVLDLPICAVDDLASTLAALASNHSVRCLAAAPRAASTLECVDLTSSCCLVLGHEGYGLRETSLAACSEAVAVPMAAGVDSLNVASASAVILYEAWRQRHHANG